MPLCGHATLAAAHVIGRSVTFHTAAGDLACSFTPEGLTEMDFPADPPEPAELPEGIGLEQVAWFGRGRRYALAQLNGAAAVRTLVPDFTAIAAQFEHGLIVTAPGDRAGVDCVSRFFAPNLGVPEDPVTGSAHCTLAPFWAPRLGRPSLLGEQASSRGGTVHMRTVGDRVVLGGRAVRVARVSFLL